MKTFWKTTGMEARFLKQDSISRRAILGMAAFWLATMRTMQLSHFSPHILQKLCTEAVVRRCSVKKVLLKFSQNSLEKRCARVSFLINLPKEILIQVFSCEFCEIFINTVFIEHLWWLLLYVNIPVNYLQ